MTADEYFYDPDETNRKRELACGILREPPAPFYSHQRLSLRVARLIADHVEPRQLGEVVTAPIDVVLDYDRALIVQPDVLFIAADRLSIVNRQVWGAPDLAVEILSSATAAYERVDKYGWYREYGVREYWIVDPFTESVVVCDFTGSEPARRAFSGTDAIRSTVIPDFNTAVAALFL